jgi:hypothetical protein
MSPAPSKYSSRTKNILNKKMVRDSFRFLRCGFLEFAKNKFNKFQLI